MIFDLEEHDKKQLCTTEWTSYPLAKIISILCATGMVLVFAILQLRYQLQQEELRDGLIYLIALGGTLSGSHMLLTGIRHWESGGKPKACLCLATALFLCTFFGRNIWGVIHNLIDEVPWIPPLFHMALFVTFILKVFWIFVMVKTAEETGRLMRKGGFVHVYVGSLLYMVLSFCGIWILQKVPQPVISTFVGDPISFDETFPEMLVLTIVSWMVFCGECLGKRNPKQLNSGGLASGRERWGMIAGIVTGAILYLGTFLILLSKCSRLRQILYSLGIHLFDAPGSMQDVGWLDYRMSALQINWNRQIENIGDWMYNPVTRNAHDRIVIFTWNHDPLISINAACGKAAVVVLLLLFAGTLIAAAKIPYQNEHFRRIARYIRLELWMIAVMGFIRELFLFDTPVSPGSVIPFLGCGVEWIPLLYILYFGQCNERRRL